MNLCLGTVQFGLDYGIAGQKKKPLDYCIDCLDYATQNGVTAIDTAAAYGNAEEIVGAFLQKKTLPRKNLRISSKMLPTALDDCKPEDYYPMIKSHLLGQLKTLHTDYLDAYLLHDARYAMSPGILDALKKVKDEGLALHTGVSVYDPEEAFACMQNGSVDFLQLPFSIFDQRMQKTGVFERAKKNNVVIDSRSAFTQGLIFLDEEQLPPFLKEATPVLQKMKQICAKFHLTREELAFAYVKSEPAISHLVFGIDSKEQLKEGIRYFNADHLPPSQITEIAKEFEGIDINIIKPNLWKK
jgi:aryl-alcohol dehydrogenase-like predicted oxidoreductase